MAIVAQDNAKIDRYWQRIQKFKHKAAAIENQHWETEVLPLRAAHRAISLRCIALIEEDIGSYQSSLASLGVVVCGTLAQTLVQLRPESDEAHALKHLSSLSECLQFTPDQLRTSHQDEELVVHCSLSPEMTPYHLTNYLSRLSHYWKNREYVGSSAYGNMPRKIGIVELLSTVPHSDGGAS